MENINPEWKRCKEQKKLLKEMKKEVIRFMMYGGISYNEAELYLSKFISMVLNYPYEVLFNEE